MHIIFKMAVPVATTTASGGGSKFLGKSSVKFFRKIFIFIFIVIPLLYAVVLTVQERDIGAGVEYFGPRLVEPIKEVNDNSINFIENRENLSSWKIFVGIFNIISGFYVIFLWLWVFAWLWARSPLSDKSAGFKNGMLAVMTYLTIQIIYFLLVNPDGITDREALNLPFKAIGNLIKSMPFLIDYTHGLTQPIRTNNDTLINMTENITELI